MKTLEQAAKTYADERCRAVNIYGELDTHKTQARFLDILSHFEAGAQWERERSKVLVEALEWITRPRYGTELPRCEQDEHDNNEIAARWHFEDTKTAREALANYRATGWTEK